MISRIELLNYQPYLGAHAVDLKDGVTLIEASYDDDERSSNRGGKSALLEAIPFAMYGYARTTKRDVIHHEADNSCQVSVQTSLGTFTRTWTKSGSFHISAEAQPFMSLEASLATWFMGTGESSGLFGMDAAARKELLVPVLVRDLDTWTRLAETAESRYTARRNGSSELQRAAAAAQARVEELERTVLEAPTEAALVDLRRKAEQARARLNEAQETVTRHRRRADALENAVKALEYSLKQCLDDAVPVATDLTLLQTRLEATDDKRAQLETYRKSFHDSLTRERLRTEALEAQRLRLEQQPTCPFTQQFCQVAEDTLTQRRTDLRAEMEALTPVLAELQTNLASADDALRKLETRRTVLQAQLNEAVQRNREAQTWYAQLRHTVQAHPVLQDYGLHPDLADDALRSALLAVRTSGALDAAIDDADRLADQAEAQTVELRHHYDACQDDAARSQALYEAAAQHTLRLAQAREALVDAEEALSRNVVETKALTHLVRACGTSGIPAEIAADTARVLEAYINDTLTLVETPIRVRVEPFENAATTYERVCPVCGFTHDKSAKRGTCQSCGEARTPMRKLTFALQYERGTNYRIESAGGRLMSDLACRIGYYRLMSALNGGTRWGTLAADEIFGSLDVPNRNEVYRFLSETLPKMQFGFRQILVVSHVPLELSGTEHRIRIQATRSERGSVRSRILE